MHDFTLFPQRNIMIFVYKPESDFTHFNESRRKSVRNRTKNVRIRTFLFTPKKRLFVHYQQINVLAHFLLYS